MNHLESLSKASLLNRPRFISPKLKDIGDSLAGAAVAVGIAGAGHFVVGLFVFQQLFECIINRLFVRADQLQRSRLDAFRTFGRIAHNEHGHAVRRAFFLNPAGIGKTEKRTRFEVMAVKNFDWLDDLDLLTIAKFFVGGLTHNGIPVNGVDLLYIQGVRRVRVESLETHGTVLQASRINEPHSSCDYMILRDGYYDLNPIWHACDRNPIRRRSLHFDFS